MPRTYHRVEVKRAMSAVNGDEWSTGGDDKDRSSYSKGNPTRVAHSIQVDGCSVIFVNEQTAPFGCWSQKYLSIPQRTRLDLRATMGKK